ncbi:uncharacterized protein LOC117125008 isoform X2 [Anneissia japonica]|uniref:uncharacterized protein LOC117125008 isoform X2 n=1 Tax=Anneissia japonica TaxID=1529436 RepID=UPI0014254DDA|nr:uncharacterized protein LOC117125008 isoform X2 [Anneissia japonica]
MLSYNHEYEEKRGLVKRIMERLRGKYGYQTWLDKEQMVGSTEEKMTEAVREADIVLIFWSPEYDKSKNCKFECERVEEFQKPFIVLKMEDDKMEETSCVKRVMKKDLYVKFSREADFEKNFDELLRVLILTERDIANKQPRNKPDPMQDGGGSGAASSSQQQPAVGGGSGGASSSQQQPAVGCGGAPTLQQQPARDSGDASSSQRQPGGSGGASSSRGQSAEAIPEDDYYDLLHVVSEWWESYGSNTGIHMMKVLIRQFKDKIGKEELRVANDVRALFRLMKAIGVANSLKYEVILEVVKICGLDGVETNIRKIEPTFENFTLKDVEIKTFSSYRQNLIKFGKSLSKDEIVTLGHLYNIPQKTMNHKSPWLLICALEDKQIIQENSAEKLIKRLRRNNMHKQADILESPSA